VVRPVIELHAGGAGGTGLVLSDLMPLRRAPVTVPEFPARLAWAAALVAVVVVVLGLLGVGSSTPSPVLGAGSVTVAAHDPAVGGRVPLDLDHQIPITVRHLPADIGTPRTAQLDLSLGGVQIVRSTAVDFVRGGSGLETTMDASAGRYIVGGKLDGSLTLSGPRGTVTDDFGVQTARSPFATFAGVVGIVLLLFVVAYTESLLRSLRRGRRRDNRSASIAALVVVGLVGGVTAVLWGWMLQIAAPSFLPFVVCGVLGAAAGLLAGLAGRQVGERTRARRQANRLVLVARRSTLPPAGTSPALVGT
jgi:serine/threonine-protein kinase